MSKSSFFYRMVNNLTLRVILAIVAGVLLGHFAPHTAVQMEPLGKWFIELIKLFIAPIIFLTIVTGISGMSDLKKAGRIGIKSLFYFELVTTLALAIGIAVAYWLKPGLIDIQSLTIKDASHYTQQPEAAFDWIYFFLHNFTLQVLFIALVSGILLHYSNKRVEINRILEKISYYVFKALKYVMYLAPVGAFGGMAYTIGKFGLHTLIPLAKLMGSVYLTMFLFVFLVLGSILKYY